MKKKDDIYQEVKQSIDNFDEKGKYSIEDDQFFYDFEKLWSKLDIAYQKPELNVDNEWDKFKNSIKNGKKSYKLWVKTIVPIAAIIIILILLKNLISSERQNSNISKQIAKKAENIFIPYKTTNKPIAVFLPDSSIAWINKNSSLLIDGNNYNKNVRKVIISGEVFFDVTKKETPFVVESDNIKITVLGTKFNVRNYQNEKILEIIVYEGKIKIQQKDTIFYVSGYNGVDFNKETKIFNYKKLNNKNNIIWINDKILFKDSEIAKYEKQHPEKFIITNYKMKKNLLNQTVIDINIFNSSYYTEYNNISLEIIYNNSKGENKIIKQITNIKPKNNIITKQKLNDWFYKKPNIKIKVINANAI